MHRAYLTSVKPLCQISRHSDSLLNLAQLERRGLCTGQGLSRWFILEISRFSVWAGKWSARLWGLSGDYKYLAKWKSPLKTNTMWLPPGRGGTCVYVPTDNCVCLFVACGIRTKYCDTYR